MIRCEREGKKGGAKEKEMKGFHENTWSPSGLDIMLDIMANSVHSFAKHSLFHKWLKILFSIGISPYVKTNEYVDEVG